MADDNQMTRQKYRQQQSQPRTSEQTGEETADSGTADGASRQAYAAENNRALEEVKTKRLARKLNWAIAGLVLGIIIVFLILFFTP